jgi:uncharacterized protein (TIGR02996 family)
MVIPSRAFLDDIITHPDDDAPRLIFADWLEDNGEPERAEFIRLQIQRFALPADGPARWTPGPREVELLAAHGPRWRAPLEEEHRPVFHRGFVEEVSLPSDELAAHGAKYFQAAPLHTVHLTADLASDDGPIPPVIEVLAGAGHLAHLRTLDLYTCGIGEAAARVLFASPHLSGLRCLYLGEGDTTPGMVDVLARSALDGLRELYLWDFSGGDLRDAGLRKLASTPRLAGLTTLDLLHNRVGPAGAASLAASPYLRNLTDLSLGRQACGYTPNQIGVRGMRALAGSPSLAGLTSLRLAMNQIGDKGLAALAGSPHLTRLRTLWLSMNEIGDAGITALARSANLAPVVHLDLSRNAIGDAGAGALAASPHAAGLRDLWLSGNRVRDRGVQALARSPHLTGLRLLSLSHNPVGAAGVEALVQSPWRESLSELSLQFVELTEAQKEALRTAFGDRVNLSR